MIQLVVENAVQIAATVATLAGFLAANYVALDKALIAQDRIANEAWEAEQQAAPRKPVHGQMLCVKAYDQRGAAQQLDCHAYSSSEYMLQYRSFLRMKINEGAYAPYRSPQIAVVKY